MLFFCFVALADGALDPVLTVCAMKEALALLALMTLSLIVEHQGNLAPLIEVSIVFAFCSFKPNIHMYTCILCIVLHTFHESLYTFLGNFPPTPPLIKPTICPE